MAGSQSIAKAEREKKLTTLISFASTLTARYAKDQDASLTADIQKFLPGFPLQASSALAAKQDELDRLGTELWNLSTRLRRDSEPENSKKTVHCPKSKFSLCFLRVFAFMLLDSTAAAKAKSRYWKSCIRLMQVAMKAARTCIDCNELLYATKVLERAAEYEAALCGKSDKRQGVEAELANSLGLEYFAMRITLAWKQERMDTAELMFAKSKELMTTLTPRTTETLSDLLYEIGKDALTKEKFELAVQWLERAYDTLDSQETGMLGPEASELRISIMHSIVQANAKVDTEEAHNKAWQMLKLMQTDYSDKMIVLLLNIELISASQKLDVNQLYTVILRMIRTVVLNDTNFRTIIHYIHKLKEHNNIIACKALDDLIELRLSEEENQAWNEKVAVTRIWMATAGTIAENTLDELQVLLDIMLQNNKAPFTAQATHASQALLWKRVEASYNDGYFRIVESWCKLCLHPIFEKAGVQNKIKIGRKLIQCALAQHEHGTARKAFDQMSEVGRNDPATRYMMFKVGLHSNDMNLSADSLDTICRNSPKDTTLIYACVMEAQSACNKEQAIAALEKVLDRYSYGAPTGVHLPALLRSTARLLQGELIKDKVFQTSIMEQLCKLLEGAVKQVKASQKKPKSSEDVFTRHELEWFSKNTYNMALKHCAEMQSTHLARLLDICIEFIKLLKALDDSANEGNLALRLVFCEFLATCTNITLARAEDNVQSCLQYYLEAKKHSHNFRIAAAQGIDELGGSAQADIISKHFQIVKLELEACLKLEKWDELDDLFDQCWKYKSPDHYETLADLVLVIHSCIVKAALDDRYQKKVLIVLHKIIGLTSRQPGNDITKLARWLRCLFNLALTTDEATSLKCAAQAVQLATKRHGGMDRYPQPELEWLASTVFNHAVDYYLQENDAKCKEWAEQAFVVAQWIEDDGTMRSMLMEKFATLQLEM